MDVGEGGLFVFWKMDPYSARVQANGTRDKLKPDYGYQRMILRARHLCPETTTHNQKPATMADATQHNRGQCLKPMVHNAVNHD